MIFFLVSWTCRKRLVSKSQGERSPLQPPQGQLVRACITPDSSSLQPSPPSPTHCYGLPHSLYLSLSPSHYSCLPCLLPHLSSLSLICLLPSLSLPTSSLFLSTLPSPPLSLPLPISSLTFPVILTLLPSSSPHSHEGRRKQLTNAAIRRARRTSASDNSRTGMDKNPFVQASLKRQGSSVPLGHSQGTSETGSAPSSNLSAAENPFLAKLAKPVTSASTFGAAPLFQPAFSAPVLPPPPPPPSFPPTTSLPRVPSYAAAVQGRGARVPVPSFITHGPGSIPQPQTVGK